MTYTVQQSTIDDRDRDRNKDLDRDRDLPGGLIGTHHKPGILRLHPQQHTADFTVSQLISFLFLLLELF